MDKAKKMIVHARIDADGEGRSSQEQKAAKIALDRAERCFEIPPGLPKRR